MGRQAGSIRAHRVAAVLETRATDNPPDYSDAFEVPTSSTDTRTPEQWWRAVFAGAPRPVLLFLLLVWRGVLGLRLGPRGRGIASTEPDAVRLELHSVFMTFQRLRRVVNSMAVLTTNVYYTRRLARPLWAVVGPIHRRMIPYLLVGAASFPRPAPD